MISFAASYGKSALLNLCSIRPETMKEYAKDSGKYAMSALFHFPPNPFPSIVLISAIFMTITTVTRPLKGKFPGFKDGIILLGTWSGHHAMLQVQMREELKKTVNLLSKQLDRTEDQLSRWDQIETGNRGKIEGLNRASSEVNDVVNEFKGITENLSKIIGIQREVSQEYVNFAHRMESGSGDALESLRNHQEKMQAIGEGLDKRIKLIQKHQEVQSKNIALMNELLETINLAEAKRKKG